MSWRKICRHSSRAHPGAPSSWLRQCTCFLHALCMIRLDDLLGWPLAFLEKRCVLSYHLLHWSDHLSQRGRPSPSRYLVARAWPACLADGACSSPDDRGWLHRGHGAQAAGRRGCRRSRPSEHSRWTRGIGGTCRASQRATRPIALAQTLRISFGAHHPPLLVAISGGGRTPRLLSASRTFREYCFCSRSP